MKYKLSSLSMIVMVAILACTSGCATLTKGTSQSLTITTDPSGAVCTLTRDGETIGVVNPTPGTLTIKKDKDDISVVCKKQGFQDSADTMSASFQGMTLGNAIFGGLVGITIDSMSGAACQYETMLSIMIVPLEFKTPADKDAFFNRMKEECLAKIEKESNEIAGRYSEKEPDNATKINCEKQNKALEAQKERRLADIERKRSVSYIANN
ncbi:MAG: hypothetical protein WA126_01565 [Thermodesulfovibrionales bacterium]